jgi:hypothetical protein
MASEYNLKRAEASIIRRCILEHPNMLRRQQAALLGISERSLFRRCKELNIVYKTRAERLEEAKKFLESSGYKVISSK